MAGTGLGKFAGVDRAEDEELGAGRVALKVFENEVSSVAKAIAPGAITFEGSAHAADELIANLHPDIVDAVVGAVEVSREGIERKPGTLGDIGCAELFESALGNEVKESSGDASTLGGMSVGVDHQTKPVQWRRGQPEGHS
jgi:hypothetical protein